MKYEVNVTILKPLEEVVGVMEDTKNAFGWMKGLKEYKLLEGEMGQEGSKYEMIFDSNGKVEKMTETVVEKKFPDKIVTVYEAGKVWNQCENLFRGHADHTHYKMISTFKFPWYMELFMWMFKPMFKKQTEQGLLDFKEYMESK